MSTKANADTAAQVQNGVLFGTINSEAKTPIKEATFKTTNLREVDIRPIIPPLTRISPSTRCVNAKVLIANRCFCQAVTLAGC
jgi:hypothetical protein